MKAQIGSFYTGIDRSFPRSIYRVVKMCKPSELDDEQLKFYRPRELHTDVKGSDAVIVDFISYKGDTKTGWGWVSPVSFFLENYRLATPEEIEESAKEPVNEN